MKEVIMIWPPTCLFGPDQESQEASWHTLTGSISSTWKQPLIPIKFFDGRAQLVASSTDTSMCHCQTLLVAGLSLVSSAASISWRLKLPSSIQFVRPRHLLSFPPQQQRNRDETNKLIS